jgi:transposase
MRGKKGEKHGDPDDPPRIRANKQRGHGTYDNDRLPIVGTVGRHSGKVRLRVVKHTDKATLCQHVETFTRPGANVNTDEWMGYRGLPRKHSIVSHRLYEWARDEDGDGIREVHVNTIEGMWTSVRNFLRPFRGVHKKYLSRYVAMCEFSHNLKKVTPRFISALVALHSF